MAPEVMCKQNYGVCVDYYALGVLAYECMLGKRPYNGKTRRDIRSNILNTQVQIYPHEIPKCHKWSNEAVDFVN